MAVPAKTTNKITETYSASHDSIKDSEQFPFTEVHIKEKESDIIEYLKYLKVLMDMRAKKLLILSPLYCLIFKFYAHII